MDCNIVRDLKRGAGAGMVSKKVSVILLTFRSPPTYCFGPHLLVFLFFKFVGNSKMWFQIKLAPH